MRKQKLGIYLDQEGIAFAQAEGKNLVFSTFFSFSSLEEDVASAALNPKAKIEELLNRGLKELKAELKGACVGISDKDNIFRFLEMPSMKKKELQLALPLEAEKYMPFKIEDLAWDYKEKRDFREKKIPENLLNPKVLEKKKRR